MKTRRQQRLRKRGGAAELFTNPKPVYICPRFKLFGANSNSNNNSNSNAGEGAYDECIAAFCAERHLTVIEVPNDGNCFFHSLKQFGRIMGVDRLFQHTSWLRRHVARFVDRHWDERYVDLYGNSRREMVNDIRSTCKWDCEAGDLTPAVTPDALRINLIIYDMRLVEEATEGYFKFEESAYRDPSYDVTVQLIRVNDGHFMLLLPDDTPNIPADTQKKEPKEKNPLDTPSLEYVDGMWIEVDVDPAEVIQAPCPKKKSAAKSKTKKNKKEVAATASSSAQNKANANLSHLLNVSLTLNNTKKKGKSAAKKTAKKSGKNAANQNNSRQQMINQILANKSLNNVTRNAMIQSLYE